MMKKVTWEEVRKAKSINAPRFRNSILMKKAIEAADQIIKLPFVLAVGIFGSTARGEDGNDIDLLVLDDGRVSALALENIYARAREKNDDDGSGGAYADACYLAFMEKLPENSLNSLLFKELCNEPAIDIIVVGVQAKSNQDYIDLLAKNMNDPLFLSNISADAMLFCRENREFRKKKKFPRFINGGVPSFHNSAPAKKEMVGFNAIGGQAKAKIEIMNLSLALKNPKDYERWGTRPTRGVCLFGPPGNGKTLLAEALALETDVPFYIEDASEIVSMWYGQEEKNINEIFEKARKTGGIIFFDEADSLAQSRSSPATHSATKRLVDALCRNMDGFRTSDNVIVFFATNRLRDIDRAVMRPGRIDKIIEVPLPDREGRKEIFEIHMKKAEETAGRKLFEPLDVGSSDIAELVSIAEKIANRKIDASLDWEAILDKTDGFSGADIFEIIRRTLEAKLMEERSGKIPGLVTARDMLGTINSYEGR